MSDPRHQCSSQARKTSSTPQAEALVVPDEIVWPAREEDIPWEVWTDGQTRLVKSFDDVSMSPRGLRYRLRQYADMNYLKVQVRLVGQAVMMTKYS